MAGPVSGVAAAPGIAMPSSAMFRRIVYLARRRELLGAITKDPSLDNAPATRPAAHEVEADAATNLRDPW